MKPFYPEYKMNLKVSNTGAVVVSKSSFSLLRDVWKRISDILAFIFLSVQLDPNFLANNNCLIDVCFFQHQLQTKFY